MKTVYFPTNSHLQNPKESEQTEKVVAERGPDPGTPSAYRTF